MAKKNVTNVKLVSSAGTGHYYVKGRNQRKLKEKLSFMKYDPVARKHVQYNEKKLTH